MPSPMLQMALDLLVHGLQHFIVGEPLDNRLAVLHMDQAVELVLKERVRTGGVNVMKPNGKESISLYDAYKQLEVLAVPIHERANLELLHEQRNQIQHLFSSPDENTTRFHLDNTLLFVARFLADEFGLRLLDYIPDPLMTHEKLHHIEDMEKLRLLYENAETHCRSSRYPEAISGLLAAIDWSIQKIAERRSIELTGVSTTDLVNEADAKRLLSRPATTVAKRILQLNTDITAGTLPTEQQFLESLNRFRLLAVA